MSAADDGERSSSKRARAVFKRYGVACLSAVLVLFLRAVLPFPESTGVYQLPLTAVVLAAWYGGRGPGLLATLICGAGVLYLFLPPKYTFELSPQFVLPFSIFIALCLLLSEFSAGRRRVEHALKKASSRQEILIRDLGQREQELRARQEMLDLAQSAARAVAFDWYIDSTQSHNQWSPELEAMYGLEPGTFDGTYDSWKKLLHPDDWPSVKLAIERANESGDVVAEYRVIHKDGSVRWLRAKGRMFFDADTRPLRMVGFMFDVTDRRQAEEALRASEKRFRTFFDRASDAFFVMDAQYRVVDINRQACESLGLSREELIGMTPSDFDALLDGPTIERLSNRLRVEETITFETRHRRKDGNTFPVEIRTGTFTQGGELFYLALARDISERRLTEETLRGKDRALEIARAELARISRLTTLGELTTSIAHEVSQPLGAMVASAGASARWLAASPPALAEARAALDNIVADGKRARDVIARIRALTKRQVSRKYQLDINHEIDEVLALTEHELRSHDVVLRKDLERTLPSVTADRVQLQQVLLNLIVNAIEAMSGVHERQRELSIVSRHRDADSVLIEVRDSGTGLDPRRAEQIFEAFYTTKPDGIGIGLAISRSIVDAHGGRLWASPNEPHGAAFRFSLPIAQEVDP